MALINTTDFDTPGNFTYDSAKVEFSGSQAQLKLQNNAALTFTEDFADDTGFTYNPALAEFTGGLVQQINTTPTNSVLASLLTSKDLSWRNDGGSLTGTLNGSPTFGSGKMVCTGTQGVGYTRTTSAQESIKFKYTPNYSGAPVTNINMVSTWNGTNNNDKFFLQHSPSGDNFRVTLNNSTGTVIIGTATTIGASSVGLVASTEYEIEVVLDSTAGTVRLFVDGVLHGTLSPGAWTRGSVSATYGVGASAVSYNRAEASFDDYIVFSTAQHSSGYTPGYTLNATRFQESSVELPEFDHGSFGSIVSLSNTALATTEANAVRYTVELDQSGTELYWSGAAWVASDGSYAQANIKADLNTNAPALAISGDRYLTIYAKFSDTNTQANLADLTLTYTGTDSYPTDDPTVTVNTTFKSDGLLTWASTISTVSGSEVKFTVIVGGQDKYWNGSAWADSDGTYAQANTSAEITTNIATLDISALGENIKFRAFLHSDSGLEQAAVSQVVINYDFSVPAITEADEVIVYGSLRDILGEIGFTDASVKITNPETFFNGDVAVLAGNRSATVDSVGNFDLSVIETATVSKTYTMEINYTSAEGIPQTVSMGTFTAPDQASVNIKDLTFT